MAIFFTEVSGQEVLHSKKLLKRRRQSRLMLIAFSYGFLSAFGGAVAAFSAGFERGAFMLFASGILSLLLIFGILYARSRIRADNRALDRSLDIIASTRAMAIEGGIPATDQERLSAQFHDIRDMRARNFFGVHRALF